MPPRLARLIAIVAAVGLIGGALVVRELLDDDDPPEGPEASAEPSVRLLCDEDFGEACGALEFLPGVSKVEAMSAGAALELLSSDDFSSAQVPYDAWVTLDPWPAMLDVARDDKGASPLIENESVPIASSPVALLSYPDFPCAGEAAWDCLAGSLTLGPSIGLPSPDTATGALTLGHALAGLVGRTDIGIDVVADPSISGTLDGLLGSGRGDAKTIDKQIEAIVTQQGSYDAVVTTHALALQAAASKRGRGEGLEGAQFAPSATLGVILAPLGRRGPEVARDLTKALRGQTVTDAFAKSGWNGPPARTSGLPDPDVIYALREEF